MLTIFNRKELIVLVSMNKMFRVRAALSNAGIESIRLPSTLKSIGLRGLANTDLK